MEQRFRALKFGPQAAAFPKSHLMYNPGWFHCWVSTVPFVWDITKMYPQKNGPWNISETIVPAMVLHLILWYHMVYAGGYGSWCCIHTYPNNKNQKDRTIMCHYFCNFSIVSIVLSFLGCYSPLPSHMLPSLLLRLCNLKMGYAVHPVFFVFSFF